MVTSVQLVCVPCPGGKFNCSDATVKSRDMGKRKQWLTSVFMILVFCVHIPPDSGAMILTLKALSVRSGCSAHTIEVLPSLTEYCA